MAAVQPDDGSNGQNLPKAAQQQSPRPTMQSYTQILVECLFLVSTQQQHDLVHKVQQTAELHTARQFVFPVAVQLQCKAV